MNKTTKHKSEENENQKNHSKSRIGHFPIVGIGASAGGLEALEQFFGNTPEDNGIAFVVIQHLDPTRPGIMPELLQRLTTMKVFQATDNLNVKANCVYVIPPNKSMSILNGTLHLFDPIESRGLRLPIDIFFRSLADDMQEKSIGIILSGMGSDGCLGLKAIKEKNGVVLVQEPSTAKFDGMPQSAIEAINPDIVAPAEQLLTKLISFLKFIPQVNKSIDIDSKNKNSIDKIIILLREQTGHDFSLYKKNTLMRRIERRKNIHQIEKLDNYVRYCQENHKEVETLFKELLIGVTSFFRDMAVWDNLKEHILPELIEELPNGYVLRAWVAGCSTGEEAYSLAIVFKEVLGKISKHKKLTLQIFATDLDSDAIEIARKGVFSSNIVADVSPERINRFFNVEAEGFRLNTDIREMVVFAPQNVIKDPPFTRLDILSCRNMLIYMEPELQKKLMTLFNYSLNPGGVMLLGSAETLGNNKEGFEELDARLKIYKRTVTSLSPRLLDFPSSFSYTKNMTTETKPVSPVVENIQALADQILLQRFAPASILANDKGDIMYITGRIEKYLELVSGKPNWNIFAMAREGLRQALPSAFRKVMQNFDPFLLESIKVENNGATQMVNITVQRIEFPNAIRGLIMIIFNDLPLNTNQSGSNSKVGRQSSNSVVKELEIKLQRSYEDLQSTREEMQSSQEELKSTNEELQSSNEELQSTNEELTTSKEEMQSMNEELQSVNIEMQSKVNDFLQASDDMKNLLNSTEVATLFLDKELNIRRFTDNVLKLFKLRNADIGRPFTDLVSILQYPEMDAHARMVLKTLSTIETASMTNTGKWYNVRIMPYRTLDDHIDGLVITFSDITIAKRLEIELKETNIALTAKQEALAVSETRYRHFFESAKEGILIIDAKTGEIKEANPYLIDILGYSQKQMIEKAIWEIGFLKNIVPNKDRFTELLQKEFVRYENLPLETADGQSINVEFISNVYSASDMKVIQCQIREIKNFTKLDETI